MTDDQELLTLYAAEAAEHLGVLNETLLRLETMQGADDKERKRQIEALGRAAHSLKGASRVVGISPVEKLAHRMESIFDGVQAGKLALDADIADVLYDALDTIQEVLSGTDTIDVEGVLIALEEAISALPDSPVPVVQSVTTVRETPARITQTLAIIEPTSTPGFPIPAPEESIRVAVSRLDDLMADSSDLLVARSGIEQRLEDVKALRKANQKWQKEWRRVRTLYIRAVRQSTQSDNDEWSALLTFLNLTQRYMRLSTQQLLALDRALAADSLRLNLISDSLQDNIRRVRLVPFEMHISTFQRAVRDLAREEGKEVALQVTGASIELDKRVLETIKDPILHLLRNSVDHGIELPDERKRNGKPADGIIILALSQRGGNVSIILADDGRGIDVSAVRRAARRVLSESEIDAMSDDEALSLIMLPGLSTSSQVTQISGRGIGLDVVRQNVEGVQGRIAIENSPGGGTTFRLTIPVSLSTMRCMLARVGSETYAIPTASIEQIVKLDTVPRESRFTAAGRPMLTLNDRTVTLAALAAVLERPSSDNPQYVVIVGSGDRRMGFLVDDLITEQEMVVKNLNFELSRVKHVAGATLLGSGEVVIILNVGDLIKTAQNVPTLHFVPAKTTIQQIVTTRTILVVDDSITTRTLEKNILEAAGFEVITATNGLEAFDALDRSACALVVADVEMPYMDGIELTTRLRHHDRYQHLPVILVTSLDTEEHKARGFHAGADAYIVKGNFNQGELLQTVRQLLGH